MWPFPQKIKFFRSFDFLCECMWLESNSWYLIREQAAALTPFLQFLLICSDADGGKKNLAANYSNKNHGQKCLSSAVQNCEMNLLKLDYNQTMLERHQVSFTLDVDAFSRQQIDRNCMSGKS